MSADELLDLARLRYEQAVFGGDVSVLAAADQDLDVVEAELTLARGRIMHARFLADRVENPAELVLFERAALLYGAVGDVRGEAESRFWIGCYHQVVDSDDKAAAPELARALELAAQAGDKLTMSYALRHLGFAAHTAGRTDEARTHLTESTRLRREIGFRPGVAANLIGLAYLAVGDGDRDAGVALLDEAGTLAADSGANGILRMVEEARADLA
jgi:hypothetical protein